MNSPDSHPLRLVEFPSTALRLSQLEKRATDLLSVLDGEIVSLDAHGYPQFEDLMFRRGELFFVCFDALWIDGEDLRQLPLIERKARLQAVVPSRRSQSRLRYRSHVERHGKALYQLTCERDLEGIVAKHRNGIYDTRTPAWIKIKNPDYSQKEGRVELFEELRG